MIDRSPSCLAAAMARAVLALMVVLAGLLPAAAQQKDKIRLAGQVWYPTFPMYTAIENGSQLANAHLVTAFLVHFPPDALASGLIYVGPAPG